jgi:hypothetical protein
VAQARTSATLSGAVTCGRWPELSITTSSACGQRAAKNSPMATVTTGSAAGWMMVVGVR